MSDDLKPAPARGESIEELAAQIEAEPSPVMRNASRAYLLAAAAVEGLAGLETPQRLAAVILAKHLDGVPSDLRDAYRNLLTSALREVFARRVAASTAAAQPPATHGDPVEHYRGELVHEATDLVVRGAGIDFAFQRTYRHQTIYDGPLGHRWDHGYNLSLRVDDQLAVLSTGGGRLETYHRHARWGRAGFSYYVPPDGVDATIEPLGVPDAPVGWVRRAPDGLRHVFEPVPAGGGSFRLARIEDRWGNHLRFVYAGERLERCHVNHDDRWVRFAYDELGRIIRLTDHTDRGWRYRYDAHGDLIGVTTPATPSQPRGATTEYRYTSAERTGALAHLLRHVVDAAGRHYLETRYGMEPGQPDYNRVVYQREGGGDFWFRYEGVDGVENGLAVEDRPAMRCWVKEKNGAQTLFVYNAWGALLWRQETDRGPGHTPRQVVWRYRYNRDGALVASRTPEGVVRHVLTGREHFLRVRGIDPASEAAAALWLHDDLTADVRRGFGRVLATVDRARAHSAATIGWADRWGDVYAVAPDDVIVKHTYEPAYGQPLTTSDPRATAASDPRATEDAEHDRLLTRYEYTGPAGDPTRDLQRVIRPTPTLPDGTAGEPIVTEILERDPRGRVTRARDAAGTETWHEYVPEDPPAPLPLEAAGFLYRTTIDPGDRGAGHLDITTEHRIDRLGRVVATTLPRGVDSADGRFVVETDHDALDRVIAARRATPRADEIRTFYEPAGKPARIETDLGGAARAGRVRCLYYDEDHRLRKETVGSEDLSSHVRTAHKYDAAGNLRLTIAPNDHATVWKYDTRDQLVHTIRGHGAGESIETLVRDRDGRVIEHRSPEGRTTRTAYDDLGRVVAVVDPLGHVTRTSHDKGGRSTVVRHFERRVAPAPIGETFVLLARTETVYDELGRPVRVRASRFETPPPAVGAGELATAYEDGAGVGTVVETRTFFDGLDRVVAVVDPTGGRTSTVYDAAGRAIRVTDPTGNRIETQYDAHGNPTRVDRYDVVRDLDGNAVGTEVLTRYATYDERDRLETETDALGNVTTHRYDALDREVRTVDPLGNVRERVFDLLGRLVQEVEHRTDTGDGSGMRLAPHVVRYEHDRAGLVTARIDARGKRTEYRRDKWDRVVEQVFPDGARISTQYDRDSLVVAVRDAHGVVVRTIRDGAGRPIRTVIDTSEVEAGLTIEGTTRIDRTFDGLGRERTAETREGAAITTTLATYRDSLGSAVADELTVAGSLRRIERTFDAAGRITALRYPGGRELGHVRDAAGRLRVIRHDADGAGYPGVAGGPRPLVAYAHVGDRVGSIAHANGVTASMAHDATGRPIELQHAGPAGALLRIQQLRDGARAPRVRFEHDGDSRVERFGYDARYQLTVRQDGAPTAPFELAFASPPSTRAATPPLVQPRLDALIGPRIGPDRPQGADGWRYDLAGNREQVVTSAATVDYLTDDRDRYQAVGATTHAYDRAGNLVFDGTHHFVYDGLRRLVRVVEHATLATVARYRYDASGRVVVEEHGGADVLVSAHDGPDRIADYRGGVCVAQYVHGPAIDDPVHLAAGGTEHHYHLDLQGSVRALTTLAGDVAAAYRFDPFGVLVASSGAPLGRPGPLPAPLPAADVATQPFGYTARPFDPSLGLYDLRARTYSPPLGRFLQRDPAGPVDGHLYTYAGNHPLAFADPSGLEREERVQPQTPGGLRLRAKARAANLYPDADFDYDALAAGTPIDKLPLLLPSVNQAAINRGQELIESALPGWATTVATAAVGAGDAVTFGASAYARSKTRYANTIDTSSAAYQVGFGAATGAMAGWGLGHLAVAGRVLSMTATTGVLVRQTTKTFVPPKTYTNRHGQLTNGLYVLDDAAMVPHTTGSLAKGKSQFLYRVNEKQLTLDAAAFADDAGLWAGSKAKVELSDFIGVHARTGERTTVLNLYRTRTRAVHGAPGTPR